MKVWVRVTLPDFMRYDPDMADGNIGKEVKLRGPAQQIYPGEITDAHVVEGHDTYLEFEVNFDGWDILV